MQPITAKALLKDLWPTAPAGVTVTSVVTDNREAQPGSVFVAIRGERVDGHDYARAALEAGAVLVVAERPIADVPADRTVLVADVLDAMITMGANYRAGYSPLMLGVTGSVGKTSTKEFCAAVLSAFGETLKTEGNQNNEIGLPKTLFRLDENVRYAVLEMGMQKPGEIGKLARAARPDGGIITKIGTSHFEHFGSREAIRAAKMELCAGLPAGAPLVLNGDDELLREASIPEGIHAVYAGVEDSSCEVFAADVVRVGGGQCFTIRDRQFGEFGAAIPVLGRHYVLDALLAYTAATRLGLSADTAAAGLTGFVQAGTRQLVSEVGGITLIEDYYNANPDSMRAALATLSEVGTARRVAVLGDMLELGDIAEEAHTHLGEEAATAGATLVVTVGELAAQAAKEAHARGAEAHAFSDNREAGEYLRGVLHEGDTVLLKASRGMRFEEIAAVLKEE